MQINPIVAAALQILARGPGTAQQSCIAPEPPAPCLPPELFVGTAERESGSGGKLSDADMVQSQYQRFEVCARVHALTPQRCLSHNLFSRRGWQRRTRGAAGWTYWDAMYLTLLLSQ